MRKMTPKEVPVSTILYEKMHLGSGGSVGIKVSRKRCIKNKGWGEKEETEKERMQRRRRKRKKRNLQ